MSFAQTLRTFFMGRPTVAVYMEDRPKHDALYELEQREKEARMAMLEAEAKLREAISDIEHERNQLRLIFDAMPQCVYVSDLTTHEIYYVNQAVQTYCGPHLVGRKCYEVFQGQKTPCAFCNNPTLLNGQHVLTWEFYNEFLKRHFQIMDTLIDWPGIGPARLEVATDITDLKVAQAKLKYSEYECRALSAASNEAIIIHRNGKIITANRTFENLTGYTKEELADEPDVIAKLFCPQFVDNVHARISDHNTEQYRAVICTKNGDHIQVYVKPNYVDYNGLGPCRVTVMVTPAWLEGKVPNIG